jgi:biopolymer transport protein TolR
LMDLKSREGDGVVYVRADRKIAYGDVMELLGKVGESGFSRVSLLSQPSPSAKTETN